MGRLSGCPKFQQELQTHGSQGVRWHLALTAGPVSTSLYPLMSAQGESCTRYPEGDLLIVPSVPVSPGLCGAYWHVTAWGKRH